MLLFLDRIRVRCLAILGVVCAAVLAIGMLLPNVVLAQESEELEDFADVTHAALQDQSDTQMSSKPEVVYVSSVDDPGVRSQLFNDNWKFNLGEVNGAQDKTFNDSAWQSVTIPHDYSIDQPYSQNAEAESAYKLGGVGWYRKSFEVSEALKDSRVYINFDGVYMDATVYVNGTQLGTHPYGYSPFSFDITDEVVFGDTNVLAVRVNHQTPSSRWYSGSGIGRNVKLLVTNQVHVKENGVHITTPKLEEESKANKPVTTHVVTKVRNHSASEATVQIVQTIFPKNGQVSQKIGEQTSSSKVAANGTLENTVDIAATSPKLWSVDSPQLYTLRTEVKQNDKTIDTYDVDFGYRYIAYDVNTGFSLNGKKLKLKGVCLHHDQGALGSVDVEAAIRRQVRMLKRMGVNSIRTSHNTPPEVLVRISNEEGMLLDEEIFDGWNAQKNGNTNDFARFFDVAMGSSQLEGSEANKTWAQFVVEQSIARDVNAPSVIMWSLGNEMSEGTSGLPNAQATQTNLITWTKAMDTTRPVTTGDNRLKRANFELNPKGIANAGGLVGLNYTTGTRYDQIHKKNPKWILYGSEVASAVNSRGVYNTFGTDSATQQLSSYDWSKVGWGHYASDAWYTTITRDFVAGQYVWTGFDYLGEPTPWNGVGPGAKGTWPSPKNSYFGIIDTAGLPKDSYYLYQSLWNDDVHTLHMLPAWNRGVVKTDDSGNVPVVVYTDAAEVELFFTAKGSTEATSLGRRKFTKKTTAAGYTYQIYEGSDKATEEHQNMYLQWKVPYKDGTVSAKAYDESGNPIDTKDWDGRQSVTTAGAATKLTATVDRTALSADGKDLAYVTVSVTDANGTLVPNAANVVNVSVEGAGELAGLDNGSAPDHQSYRDDNRKAHAGQLVAFVRASRTGGTLKVKLASSGLQTTEVSIPVNAVSSAGIQAGTAAKSVDSLYYSRYYYVKKGSSLTLPERVQVRYSDGTSEDKTVAWSSYDTGKLDAVNDFEVKGTVGSTPVKVYVSVIDDVVALLSYSATTPVGTPAVLPTDRPGVLADATILRAAFPVTWQQSQDSVYNTAGTVVIPGTAQVFGKALTVSATIRVQNETVAIGANVSAAAKLTQDIPANKQSDTLDAIKDGNRAIAANTTGGPNPSSWSNYAYSQDGHNTAKITFTYDTQQRFGKIVAYFAQDSFSARWPFENTTRFEVSEDGTNWTNLPVQESIGEASGNVKPYTFTFAPTTATLVRMTVTNKDEVLANKKKPCTSLSEVELYTVQGAYTTNSTAALESLLVNGAAVPKTALAKGHYETPAWHAMLEPTPAGNAAVTVLPAYEDKIRVLLESEDHKTTSLFTVNLKQEYVASADDDSRDIPVANMTVSTGSEHKDPNNKIEGLLAYAFDGKDNTFYHSDWAGSTVDNLWVAMDLKEPTKVDAIRYLARPGNGNGVVTEAKVQYSTDGTTWVDAGSASWPSPTAAGYTRDWQLVTLNEPVEARYVRLQTVHSYATNGSDKYMSASEIRVRRALVTKDLADEDVTVTAPSSLERDVVNEEYPGVFDSEQVVVRVGDTKLRDGIDYVVTYNNNTAPGTASYTITGIDGYSGTRTGTFTLTQAPARLVSISVFAKPAKTTYTVGERLDPTGLVLSAFYSTHETKKVEWATGSSEITFMPSLTSAFSEPNAEQEITVTYDGKSATFTVRVDAARSMPTINGSDADVKPADESKKDSDIVAVPRGKKSSLAATGSSIVAVVLATVLLAGVALVINRTRCKI